MASLRRIRIRGAGTAVLAALDRCHVYAEVRGVLEHRLPDDAVPGTGPSSAGPEPGKAPAEAAAEAPAEATAEAPAEATADVEVWLECDVDFAAACADLHVQVEELPISPADFAHTGREHDRWILLAPDLCVRPPWVPAPAGFRGIDLVVPRGMAFGSGEHGSTQAALLALHGSWPESPPRHVLDVGTGSGILLAYARGRGCRIAVGCDLEAGAVRAARDLVPEARVVQGTPAALRGTFELVVANLTAAELVGCASDLQRLLTASPGADVQPRAPVPTLVVSGMRPAEVERVLAALGGARRWYRAARVARDGFVALVLRRRESTSVDASNPDRSH